MKRLVSFALVICMVFSLVSFVSAEEALPKGYGFINRDGEIVIEPQFQYAYGFSSGRARIFSGKLSSYGSPDEGFYGYIDETGKEVIPLIYQEASIFYDNGKAVVCKNGKYGVIDSRGEIVLDFKYDYISYSSDAHIYKAFNGTLTDYGSPKEGTYYLLDENFTEKCSISCEYLYVYEEYFEAEKNDKYAMYSYDGTQITDYIFDSLGSPSDSLIYFKKDGKYGYVDLQGKIVIDAVYDNSSSFKNGKAIVKKGNKYSLIDKDGKTITTYSFDYMNMSFDEESELTYAFEGSLGKYGSPEEGKYYLVDLDGNRISRGYIEDNCYSVDSGVWRVKENGTWYVLDLQGKELFSIPNCDYLYICGKDRYIAEKAGMYALLDMDGKNITDFIWDKMVTTDEDLIPVYSAGNEPDFRSVRWGMSEEEVRAVEGNNPDYTGKLDGRNANYIGYDSKLMGNSVLLAFYFGPDGLYEARYIWNEKHSNDNLYISDYNSVKEQLTKKYGDPWFDHESWDTASHQKNYSDDKGNALSFGYLTYETDYSTPRTNITMIMSADNYTVKFHIYYESKTISEPKEDYSNQF